MTQHPPGATAQQQAHQRSLRRYYAATVVSGIVPGAGLMLAGRRRLGALILSLAGLVLLAVVALLLLFDTRRLALTVALRPDLLAAIGVGLAVAAVLWVLMVVLSHRLLEPAGLDLGYRLGGSLIVIVLCSLVAAPLGLASRYAFVQGDLINTVFPTSHGSTGIDYPSKTSPDDSTQDNPWGDRQRVNVLLLGGDSGPERTGTRTDTMIVASIDVSTGDTVLFSLPRNLEKAPFPEGPLRRAYPNGFTAPGPPGVYILNAVYDVVPAENPKLFEGSPNPGADAIKMVTGETLGLDVHYYAMVNLAGFERLIDALGGITLNVPTEIPIGTKVLAPGVCAEPEGFIQPGVQELNGSEALSFARARCGAPGVADDYDRMLRQRCVVGAIIEQADPGTVIRRYQQIADVTKDIVSTDIPQQLLPAFADLALKVKDAQVRTLAFTDEVISTLDPDYDKIRTLVTKSLEPAPATPSSEPRNKPPRSGKPSDAKSINAVC